ncbi:hypothetical protein D027_2804B, partial [Vibrio parahaemolyticus 861]
NRIANRFVNF